MEAAPLLGDVLVSHGLLTKAQLEAALAEQKRSGRRLGAIVVEQGLVSPGAIATALGEQAGGVVRTEYGVSFGFGSQNGARPARVEPPATNGDLELLADAIAAKRQELAELTREVEALRAERVHEDTPDAKDFFVVAVVEGRYEVHLARGNPPKAGTSVRLPGAPDASFVVDRERWRRCVYVRPAAP